MARHPNGIIPHPLRPQLRVLWEVVLTYTGFKVRFTTMAGDVVSVGPMHDDMQDTIRRGLAPTPEQLRQQFVDHER